VSGTTEEVAVIELGRKATRLVASREARAFVRDHGGHLYLWITVHGRCEGKITLLEADTQRPAGDAWQFRRIPNDAFELYVDIGSRNPPSELVVQLARGGNKVKAYWNNQAYVG
jgi:hypothetical protein